MVLWHPSIIPIERKPKAGKKLLGAPPLILSLSFACLIMLGTVLLKLPIATTEPSLGFKACLLRHRPLR